MSTAPRNSAGRWTKASDNNKTIDEVAVFTDPNIPSALSTESAPRINRNWPTGLFKREARAKRQTNIGKTCSLLYIFGLVLSWITSALIIADILIGVVIAFFFLRNLLAGNGLDLATQTFMACIDSENQRSCWSTFKDIFFTEEDRISAYLVSFRIAESSIADARQVYDLSFSLLLKNPVILLSGTSAAALIYFALGYIRDFLTDIMVVAKKAPLRQNPT